MADELKIPTAPSSVWDDCIAAHPVAKVYKYTTLSNFEERETLFCGRVATGNLHNLQPLQQHSMLQQHRHL